MLENGADAIDWSGLPMAVAYVGICDVEGLIQRLQIIKAHRAARSNPTGEH